MSLFTRLLNRFRFLRQSHGDDSASIYEITSDSKTSCPLRPLMSDITFTVGRKCSRKNVSLWLRLQNFYDLIIFFWNKKKEIKENFIFFHFSTSFPSVRWYINIYSTQVRSVPGKVKKGKKEKNSHTR